MEVQRESLLPSKRTKKSMAFRADPAVENFIAMFGATESIGRPRNMTDSIAINEALLRFSKVYAVNPRAGLDEVKPQGRRRKSAKG